MMRAMTPEVENKQDQEAPPPGARQTATLAKMLSKASQRKRDSDALQKWAKLVRLSADTLKVRPGRKSSARHLEAKKSEIQVRRAKRQMQYIGQLMRDVTLRRSSHHWTGNESAGASAANALHHFCRGWRERLMVDESWALSGMIFPMPTPQEALARDISGGWRSSLAKGKPPKHFRLLYQSIHKLIVRGS